MPVPNQKTLLAAGIGVLLAGAVTWQVMASRSTAPTSGNAPMQQEITDLFDRYESQTNAALAGKQDLEAVSELYDDAFIGASPAGIMTGKKDDEFKKVMAASFAHNRAMGTRRMDVQSVRIEPIDALHALARVGWRASYDVDGTHKTIDFTNAYLTRVENGRAKVFGWITGDEVTELRKHGITG